MTTYPDTPTGRIDIETRLVTVKGNDGTFYKTTAVSYVKDHYDDVGEILAVYGTGERDHGYPIYAVEYVSTSS